MHHFKAPHDMFRAAKRYAGYLADVEIPEPPNLHDQPGPTFGQKLAGDAVKRSMEALRVGANIETPETTLDPALIRRDDLLTVK